MNYTIDDIIGILDSGLTVCNVTNTTLVHIEKNVVLEIIQYLDDLKLQTGENK